MLVIILAFITGAVCALAGVYVGSCLVRFGG